MKLHKMLFVEEHQQIYDKIVAGDYDGAIIDLETLDETNRQGDIRKIESFMVVLLTHLIKQKVQNKTTRRWERSIKHALVKITLGNKHYKGVLLDDIKLVELLETSYSYAIRVAMGEMLDIDGNLYTKEALSPIVAHHKLAIINDAMARIIEFRSDEP